MTEEQTKVVMINARHSHAAPTSCIDQITFKQALKDACIRERGTLKSIYENTAKR